MKRFAMWMTTVTTVLVLGGQMFGVTIPSLESAGVFVGTKTPAETVFEAAAPDTTPVPAEIGDFDNQNATATDVEAVTDRTSAIVISAPVETAVAVPPVCPADVTGALGSAPARVAGGGLIGGTTTADLAAFAETYNSIRVANCLQPVPTTNFRYDACMEDRLIWMAEDPSTDPASAWGHLGSVRSDGVPSVGCDGNLAGGSDNSGETMATKWWDSLAHRASLYEPEFTGSTTEVCVYFAMTHGGLPDEASTFTRAAARFGSC